MKDFIKGVILIVFFTAQVFARNESKPVQLDLFYEALCPDCTGFVTSQLYPTWKALRRHGIFSVSLYPFGNAKETLLPNGTYQYTCQHGEDECKGNLLEACIIKKANFDANAYMSTIACIEDEVMSGENIEDAVNMCLRFYMPMKSNSWVNECANGPEGARLMHKIAVRTNGLNPKHTYVPWLLLNGIHTEEYDNEATTNLMGLVCSLYKGPKPDVCSSS